MFYLSIFTFLFSIVLRIIFNMEQYIFILIILPILFFIPKRFLIYFIILVLTFNLGYWRSGSFVEKSSFNEKIFEEQLDFKLKIISESENKGETRRYVTKILKISNKENEIFKKGKIIISVPHYIYLDYGDVIRISGRLFLPEPFLTEGGNIFYYNKFLKTKNILGSVYRANIYEVESNNSFIKNLFILKQQFVGRMNHLLPYPEAPLLSGILLGVKDSLGEKRLDDYRVSGLIHIIVLSGSNVAIIIEAVRRSIPLSRKWNILCAYLFIILFAIVVGGGATVIRASIMASISLLAQFSYNKYSVYRSLWVAVFIMAFISPGIILYDSSFLLSFLATCGMVYLNPIIEPRFKKIPEFGELRFIVSSTISTYLAVLPYLLYSMGSLSLVSLPVNLITLPLVPWSMLFGFLATTISFASHNLSLPIVWITSFILKYINLVVEVSAKFKYAAFNSSVSLIGMLFGYILIVLLFFYAKYSLYKRQV